MPIFASFTARASAACCAAALVLSAGCKRTLSLTIAPAELQQRVSAVFPITRDVLLSRVTLENPAVVLSEGSDRLGVDVAFRIATPLLPPQSGTLRTSGKLAYRAAEKAFYLEEPRLDRLDIAGVPPAGVEQLRAPAETVVRLVLANVPVYQLQARDQREVAAGYVLRSVTVRNGRVEAEVGLP